MVSARITLFPSPSHIMAPAQVETQDFASLPAGAIGRMNKGSSNNDVIGKSRDAKSCVSRGNVRNQAELWDEELTATWLGGRRKILRLYWLARLEG